MKIDLMKFIYLSLEELYLRDVNPKRFPDLRVLSNLLLFCLIYIKYICTPFSFEIQKKTLKRFYLGPNLTHFPTKIIYSCQRKRFSLLLKRVSALVICFVMPYFYFFGNVFAKILLICTKWTVVSLRLWNFKDGGS